MLALPDADNKLVKADLSVAVMRAQREQSLTNAAAAKRAGVREANISRIRNGKLDKLSIERLSDIARSLDPQVQVIVTRTHV